MKRVFETTTPPRNNHVPKPGKNGFVFAEYYFFFSLLLLLLLLFSFFHFFFIVILFEHTKE
jgi:hypothetical protein